MRYVGYVRISSEDQRGNYSLDAQKHAIRLWVAQQKNELSGALVRFYEDEAFTGTNDDRPAFQDMVRDARLKQFDAIVVHKFDRLARNRRDASVYNRVYCIAVTAIPKCARKKIHSGNAIIAARASSIGATGVPNAWSMPISSKTSWVDS